MISYGTPKAKIIGHYCFLEPTVNGESYKRMLGYYGIQKALGLPGSPIFHQDGAPPQRPTDSLRHSNTKPEVSSDSMAIKFTRLDYFRFSMWCCVKIMCFCLETNTISYERKE